MVALGCIGAVAAGWLCTHLNSALVVPLVLAGVLAGVLWACVRKVGQRDEVSRIIFVGLILCAGVLRGASVGAQAAERVVERGWSDAMRSFEVVGASEPGPRCRIQLRGPGSGSWGWGSGSARKIVVAAPPEACPRASGDQVAILAPALQRTWRSALDRGVRAGEPAFNLGRGPVIWARPSISRPRWRRPLDRYWRWVAQLRQRAWSSTRGDAAASLVVAAGLGLRSALAPELRDDLRAAGLGHLIAVSGLHIAVAALWLQVLARRVAVLLGLSPAHACVLAWVPLWAYVGLTGGAASAVRAAAMLTAIELGVVVGRPTHGPTALACVAAAMLLWQPSWLVDPGFALSLAAMTAIVSAPRELGVLGMSWRITWATAPLSVLYFDVAPLHGLLGNAVALPLFGLMMPAALVASVGPGLLGELALAFARLFANPILDVCALLSRLPAAGPAALCCAAVLALALRRALPTRAPEQPSRAWLPPRNACLLAVAISAGLLLDGATDRRHVGPPRFDWVAIGTPRSLSLMVADPSSPASACLYRPTDSATTWTQLFELLQVRQLSRLDARFPAPSDQPARARVGPTDDPRTRALADQLARAGIGLNALELAAPEDHCQPPERARVRAALRACRARQGGHGRALARSAAGRISCRIEDRWVPAPELDHI
ncbi:DNA internalization-related competence protein ComEC/Rec2 [Enhygromyxa salina]|uniref:DNA internalization-related competence protein ComEC/Rec2 n=1 Tax=Enhygromyxa salina TaxID=215803 RepID=A0A0C2DCW1_9BACT|nr:DNA internalization-related competence protein ComEC/Rec2 [Enhygromyxa salina]